MGIYIILWMEEIGGDGRKNNGGDGIGKDGSYIIDGQRKVY